MSRLSSDEEITRALDSLPGWRRDSGTLVASHDSPGFPIVVQLIVIAADEAEPRDTTRMSTCAGRSRTGGCRRTPQAA